MKLLIKLSLVYGVLLCADQGKDLGILQSGGEEEYHGKSSRKRQLGE